MNPLTVPLTAVGHLIDTGLLARYLNLVVENGASYELRHFEIGRSVEEYSRLQLSVSGDRTVVESVVAELVSLGCQVEGEQEVTLGASEADHTVPDSFYSTTNHRTEVFLGGAWVPVSAQRMEACIVVDRGRGDARCVNLRDIHKGDLVVCGATGVRVQPPYRARQATDFVFMSNDISSERRVGRMVEQVAGELRALKARDGRCVVVAGPVVVHTGGGEHLARLIRAGHVQALLSGNALAVHDAERALFGTSLGVDALSGIPVHEGHMNHMRAINIINKCGGLAEAVERGVIKDGVMAECVRAGIPYVLAGSIRDDGPLPDTQMDLVAAQEETAKQVEGADVILILSTMLHGIGVANMTPSWVRIVCVDINPAVVTKLADRGSSQTMGIVAEVGLFLRLLADELSA